MISEALLNKLVVGGMGSKESHVKVRNGNIIQDFKRGLHDVLILGVSCFNEYEKGLVGNVLREFPGVQELLNGTKSGDFKKLGSNLFIDLGDGRHIVFMFIQKSDYFRTSVKTSSKIDFPCLKKCLNEVIDALGPEKSMSMPQLGIFKNKNHWLNVLQVVEEVLDDKPAKIIVYRVRNA